MADCLGGLGEVPESSRRRSHVLPVPGLLGDAPCGPPDWFEFGQPLTAIGTCVPRADGIPSCCGGVPVATGAGISGVTSYAVTPVPPPPPQPTGAAISGTTGVIPPPPPGCVPTTNSSATQLPAPLGQFCSYTLWGVDVWWWYWVTIPVTYYRIEVIDQSCPTGTWQVLSGDDAGTATVVASGTGNDWPVLIDFFSVGSGVWFEFDSNCADSKFAQIKLTALGPGPFPCTALAPTCAAAPISEFNRWCFYDGSRVGDQEIWEMEGWRLWVVIPSRTYRLRVELILGNPLAGTFRLWSGDDCGALTLLATWEYDQLDIDFTFDAIESRVWLQIDTLLASDPVTIRIRIDEV